MTSPTLREQFIYAAAQELDDDSVVFTGFHWPIVITRVARKLHAPDLTSVFEAGVFYRGPAETIPTSTTELSIFDGHVDAYCNSFDTLQTSLKSGKLDGAFVDAGTVDQLGNINSTVIGDCEAPTVRLPGPGGARDILSYGSDVTLLTGALEPHRYEQRVSYVSSPGYLDGDGSREAAGFEPGTGPSRLYSPVGLFEFDETGRATLVRLPEECSLQKARDVTGWSIPDGEYDRYPQPDYDELSVIRSVIAEANDRFYRNIRS
jgi:acyl CoA:acetate/3-ketoacid CoA transferase beta subunit